MRTVFRVLKWTLLSIVSLVFIVLLFLALDRDYRVVELSEAEKIKV